VHSVWCSVCVAGCAAVFSYTYSFIIISYGTFGSGLPFEKSDTLSVSTLIQLTATHCNSLQHIQHTATHRNTPQHTVTHRNIMCERFDTLSVSTSMQLTATHCNSLQLTATHCNTLQHDVQDIWHFVSLYFTATYCNTLQHTATHCNTLQHDVWEIWHFVSLYLCRVRDKMCESNFEHTATHCDTLQHTTIYCNTMCEKIDTLSVSTHIACVTRCVRATLNTHCSTLQPTAAHCNTLQLTATHCNILQHAVTHCNWMCEIFDNLPFSTCVACVTW